MKDFRKIAKEELTLSPLMDGRVKMSTDEIMRKYPDGVTVVAFDFVSMYDDKTKSDKAVPVFATENFEFFFGGTVLAKVAKAWVEAYDGDIELASADLADSGGIKIKMMSTRTKKGNNLTAIEII